MSRKTFTLSDELHAYVLDVGVREPELFARLREETAALPNARMQISPEQGQFMGLLVKLLGARRALEIGVFTGYSALWVATALPVEGELVACDVSEEYTRAARRYWHEAGVEGKITLRIGHALRTLEALLQEGQASSFDFVFIDADKGNYWDYFERSLQLLRQGGLITVDNVLWSGRVADPREMEEDTVAIRQFNARLKDDPRVAISLVPIGDGLTLAVKL